MIEKTLLCPLCSANQEMHAIGIFVKPLMERCLGVIENGIVVRGYVPTMKYKQCFKCGGKWEIISDHKNRKKILQVR